MAKKKKETKKIDKPIIETNMEVKKYSISELIELVGISPLYAVSFINYYGLTDDFRKEFEKGEVNITFSEDEFKKMYDNYMKRKI